MVPVAGSAYTYAYATLGELLAWIIGWDLVLEYAVASSTVAHGWSHYFVSFLGIFGIVLPAAWISSSVRLRSGHAAWVATGAIMQPARVHRRAAGHRGAGHRHPRERRVQRRHGDPQARRGAVRDHRRRRLHRDRRTGIPSCRTACRACCKGAAYIFFAYIGFDSVSTHAEEARNPQRDVPIGIIVSLLLCTVLYIRSRPC